MRSTSRIGGGLLATALGVTLLSWGWAGRARGDAEQPAKRLGDEACLECHAQYAPAWGSVRHNRYLRSDALKPENRGCEGCHGPGSKHLEDPNFRSIKNEKRGTGLAAVQPCLQCHGADVKAAQWLNTGHSKNGVTCTGCHDVHQSAGNPALLRKPKNEMCLSCHPQTKADFQQNSHHPLIEGRVNCTDCHDPHQSGLGTKALLKSGDDKCVRCHMEKRGPFAYEHQTSINGGDEGCSNCHRSHGSPNPKLLELFGRATCLQCHSEISTDANHRPRGGDCWQAGCHTRIHGSHNNRWFIN